MGLNHQNIQKNKIKRTKQAKEKQIQNTPFLL
jgi:hypothetical protein